jgi:hypothetical protein
VVELYIIAFAILAFTAWIIVEKTTHRHTWEKVLESHSNMGGPCESHVAIYMCTKCGKSKKFEIGGQHGRNKHD